jgi:hypothetical protein
LELDTELKEAVLRDQAAKGHDGHREGYLERRNGEKPVTDTANAKLRAAVQISGKPSKPKKPRKKQRGITSRTKVTNVHLPGLLELSMGTEDLSD